MAAQRKSDPSKPPRPASENEESTRFDGDTHLRDSASPDRGKSQAPFGPGTQFGRYQILKELGQGEMGAVFLAHDQQLERQVALKVPSFSANPDPTLLARFYREARAAARLQHTGICPVYDVGEIEGRHYISMAFLAGTPLRNFLKGSGRQSGKPAAQVVRKIALAMHEAHSHDIIHRDLKPANVMINPRNEPVVMDFGLARELDEDEGRLTRTGAVMGTPAYMSPEQVDGHDIGSSADIYSLGVIFYELLTGELPFQGSMMSILRQIATDSPRPPVEVDADVDPILQDLCLSMLAKHPSGRPESMKAVADHLAEWLKRFPESNHAEKPSIQTASQSRPENEDVEATMVTRGHQPTDGGAVETSTIVISESSTATQGNNDDAMENQRVRWIATAAGVLAVIAVGLSVIRPQSRTVRYSLDGESWPVILERNVFPDCFNLHCLRKGLLAV